MRGPNGIFCLDHYYLSDTVRFVISTEIYTILSGDENEIDIWDHVYREEYGEVAWHEGVDWYRIEMIGAFESMTEARECAVACAEGRGTHLA